MDYPIFMKTNNVSSYCAHLDHSDYVNAMKLFLSWIQIQHQKLKLPKDSFSPPLFAVFLEELFI